MKNFLISFLFLIFTVNNILSAEEFTEYTKANAEKCDQGNCENGQGTLIWSDGTSYVGEFKDDKINGQGTLTAADGTLIYKGEIKDDLFHGQGTLIEDGNKYVGEFKDDKFSGQGTLTFANGDKYVGEFKDDKYDGQGTLTASNGNKYEGEFKDDKFNGQGTLTIIGGNKYEGEFKDALYHGQGTLTYANGDKYVGEFKDDKANGLGTIMYANGDKIVGTFKDNTINGYGKYTYANGNKIVGRWEDGKQVESETNFIETAENKAKRDTSNDDLYLYSKNEKNFEIYEEDSENKKEAKIAFNAAARCYNSLSLIDRKKTNRDIYSSRNQLIQAMTFERSESIFGAPPEGEKKNKVSEQAYYTAKSVSDYFVGQNCPQ